MKFLLKMLVLAVLVLPFSGVSSEAQSTKQQIQDLKQQIEAIQRQNQQQIQQLQQQIELMENQRAADSEKMATIVEKDQDAWYNKFKAKYDKGLVFSTTDGKFKMKFSIRGQFRTTVTVNDSASASNSNPRVSTDFSIPRLRFKWGGHAFKPWFLYTVQLDTPGEDDFNLRDLYFTAAYNNGLAPRVGQWKVPFGRDELTSSGALQFVDRSIINDEFGLGRDRGVALLGGYGPQYNFSWSAGMFNGDGRNGESIDSNLLYAGRLQFGWGGEGDKFGSGSSFATGSAYKLVPNFAKSPTIVVGAGAGVLPGLNCDRKSPDNDTCDRMEELGVLVADYTTITGDINFKMPIGNIQGSYYGRWLDPDEAGITQDTAYDQGFNVQAGAFLMPKTVEIAGRFSYIDYDDSSSVLPGSGSFRSDVWTITPGISYYISRDHRWKIQLDYTYEQASFTGGEPDEDENLIRAQLQAVF